VLRAGAFVPALCIYEGRLLNKREKIKTLNLCYV
jgi:hypothetical protein